MGTPEKTIPVLFDTGSVNLVLKSDWISNTSYSYCSKKSKTYIPT